MAISNTSGVSCVITNEHINEILDLSGFEDVNTVYGGSFPSQMVAGINEGIGSLIIEPIADILEAYKKLEVLYNETEIAEPTGK